MADAFRDGCDSYTATADLTKKWWAVGSAWSWSSTAGRNGGGAIQCVGGSSGTFLMAPTNILGGVTLFGVMFWMKLSGAPSGNIDFLDALDSGNFIDGKVQMNSLGQFFLTQGGGTLRVAGSKNVADNVWHWIEVYWNINTGTCKLYIDGVVEWNNSFSGQTGNITYIQFGSIGNSRTLTLDDIHVFDNNGASPLCSDIPIGPREIITLRPTADNTVQFSPNTGATNYTQINEVNGDGDSSYVQDGTSGHQDLYDFADLTTIPASITSVVANAYVENPNPGSINFQQVAKSGGTTSTGTSTQAPSAYRVVQQAFATDPNTSAAWTGTNLNAAQFGIKVP